RAGGGGGCRRRNCGGMPRNSPRAWGGGRKNSNGSWMGSGRSTNIAKQRTRLRRAADLGRSAISTASGNEYADNLLISTMDTSSRIPSYYKTVAVWIERLLALVILGGVLVFGLCSTQTMAAMEWRQTETFY